MYALFTKINGHWRFEGFANRDRELEEFKTSVNRDIETCRVLNLERRTEAYKVVNLDD